MAFVQSKSRGSQTRYIEPIKEPIPSDLRPCTYRMPCSSTGQFHDDVTDAGKLQFAAIQRVQISKLVQIRKGLKAIKVPTIKKEALGGLSMAFGRPLDLDDAASVGGAADTFFAPCDWSLDDLQRKTWRERYYWRNLDAETADPAILLQFPLAIMSWYEQCLFRLSWLTPNLWDYYWYVN